MSVQEILRHYGSEDLARLWTWVSAVRRWDQGVFRLGRYNMEGLKQAAEEADFARDRWVKNRPPRDLRPPGRIDCRCARRR